MAVAAVASLSAVLLGELAVHRWPRLLPRAYRDRFPLHGIELFHPGLLARTPVDRIPLPLVDEAGEVPLPADLKRIGVAPADERSDRARFPRLVTPVDALGLPNPVRPERADVVLVGDSFLVVAGWSEPLGLRGKLAQRTGREVYACALGGIGPVRELALLEQTGLPLEPSAVIWFFFGGNDVIDAATPEYYRRTGRETHAEAFAELMPPRFLLVDAFRAALRRAERADRSLPPLRLPRPDGGTTALWIHPGHLTQTLWSADEWKANPGWSFVTDALRRAAATCAEHGARLLVVYLPTKTEVYLPYVERDAELVHRFASFGLPEPHPLAPEELLERALAGRGDVERCVAELCAAEDIAFLSATPLLEPLAARGELAYFTTDTHWTAAAQETLVEPLAAWLERAPR